MIRSLRPLLLALTLAAAACSENGVFVRPDLVEGVPGEPAAQRNVWEQQDIDDYRFAYARVCFCIQQPIAQVTVRDGRIVDVRDLDTGRQLPREQWATIPTVEQLFEQVEAARAGGVHTEVRYHPALGYPVDTTIGTLANDAGARHLVSGLEEI